jgi:aquaporin Z
MKKLIVEFIGTFFLVLVVILSVIKPGTEALAPLAVGAILMVMVYAGGHISGGHYNPGVTLGAWMRGKITGKEAVPYWIAQLLGAVAAALISIGVSGSSMALPASYDVLSLLIVEFLFSFALVYVVTGGIANARHGSFADAFFFSVQTVGTIGYGAMYPQSMAAHLAVTAESILSLVKVDDEVLGPEFAEAKAGIDQAGRICLRGEHQQHEQHGAKAGTSCPAGWLPAFRSAGIGRT